MTGLVLLALHARVLARQAHITLGLASLTLGNSPATSEILRHRVWLSLGLNEGIDLLLELVFEVLDGKQGVLVTVLLSILSKGGEISRINLLVRKKPKPSLGQFVFGEIIFSDLS